MKKILWVSRHILTDEQLNDLKRIYGEFELETLDETITNIDHILLHDADVYAVVLPIDLIAELKNKTNKEIIRPVSERVKISNEKNTNGETEYKFKHKAWQRIVKAEIIVENL